MRQLRNDFVDAKPIDFDYAANRMGRDYEDEMDGRTLQDQWDTVDPDFSDFGYRELRTVLEDNLGYEGAKSVLLEALDSAFGDLDTLRDAVMGELQNYDPDWISPAMNFAYPIAGDAGVMQSKLLSSSLCVVDIGGEPFLALQGGGMDMSREICLAYIELGFLPPAHFSVLPGMAGEPPAADLIEACLRSLDMVANWTASAAKQMRERYPS